jgi:hypothetical protein
VAGGDVFADKGRALGMKGTTISEQWGKCGWYVRRGDTRRVAGLSNIRVYLHEQLYKIASTQNGMLGAPAVAGSRAGRAAPRGRAEGRRTKRRDRGRRRVRRAESRAFVARPHPLAADAPKLGDDPLREVAYKVMTGDVSEPEWNNDGTPCYIPPETYEEVS